MTSGRLAGQGFLSNVRIWGELQAPAYVRRGLRRLHLKKLDSPDKIKVKAEGRGKALKVIATSFSSWIEIGRQPWGFNPFNLLG